MSTLSPIGRFASSLVSLGFASLSSVMSYQFTYALFEWWQLPDAFPLAVFFASCSWVALGLRALGSPFWYIPAIFAYITTVGGVATKFEAAEDQSIRIVAQDNVAKAQATLAGAAATDVARQIETLPKDIEIAQQRVIAIERSVAPLREQVAVYQAQLACEATALPEGCLGLNNKPVRIASEGPNWAALSCRLSGLNCADGEDPSPLLPQLEQAEERLTRASEELAALRLTAQQQISTANEAQESLEQAAAAVEASQESAVAVAAVSAWGAITFGLWSNWMGVLAAYLGGAVIDFGGPKLWQGGFWFKRPARPWLIYRIIARRDAWRIIRQNAALSEWKATLEREKNINFLRSLYRSVQGENRRVIDAKLDEWGAANPYRLSDSLKSSFSGVQDAKAQAPKTPMVDLGDLAFLGDVKSRPEPQTVRFPEDATTPLPEPETEEIKALPAPKVEAAE